MYDLEGIKFFNVYLPFTSVCAVLPSQDTMASFNGFTPFTTLPEMFTKVSKETNSSCCNFSMVCFVSTNLVPFFFTDIVYLSPPFKPFIILIPLSFVLYVLVVPLKVISTLPKGLFPLVTLTVTLYFSLSALKA